MFTGDRSGDWLFRALYRAGFANQPISINRLDGLRLTGCYITATLRCAPPQNAPLASEINRCRPFLLDELRLLRRVRVVIGLGRIGFENVLNAYRETGRIQYGKKPLFAHGAMCRFDNLTVIASFHPSQQNTFTGRLTEMMFDRVFTQARQCMRAATYSTES
jgi:uracil-DNA glycosylase family 4